MAERTFITKSTYSGTWNTEKNCMSGLGRYVYPDGSEYRGYFKDGMFHGCGCLTLAAPYKTTFKGMFKKGVLVSIDDMRFADGLRVTTPMNEESQFTLEFWKYCTKNDRRYQRELKYGLTTPINPNDTLTNGPVPRKVPYGCYDTVEGIYDPETGMLTRRPPPLPKKAFVACETDRQWILKHCRTGPPDEVPVDDEEMMDRGFDTDISDSMESETHSDILLQKAEDMSEALKTCQRSALKTSGDVDKICKARSNLSLGHQSEDNSSDNGSIASICLKPVMINLDTFFKPPQLKSVTSKRSDSDERKDRPLSKGRTSNGVSNLANFAVGRC